MAEFDKTILVALTDFDDGDGVTAVIVATIEEAAKLNADRVGRYKLVGTGSVLTFYDYVEDERAGA